MAWKKVVTESTSGKIAQEAASLLNQGALATLDTVDTAQIDASAIETAKINDNAVTNAKMADNAIALDQLYVSADPTNGQFATADTTGGGITWVDNPNTTIANTDTTYAISAVDNAPETIIRLTASGSGTGSVDVGIADGGGISWATSGTTITPSLSVPNDHITHARYQNIASGSLIYRKTAGTGDAEVNTLATLKTDLGLTGTNSGDQTVAYTSAIPNITSTVGGLMSNANAVKFAGISASADVNRTLDANPTNGNSTNSVSSNGVFDALADKAPKAGSASNSFSTLNLTVAGNLTVSGTSTIENTTTETIHVADNTIVLDSDKSGSADINTGIVVERGASGRDQAFYWDEGNDKWQFSDSTDQTVGGTYLGDVLSQYNTGTYDANNNTVPVGHFQWDGTNLYVRTA